MPPFVITNKIINYVEEIAEFVRSCTVSSPLIHEFPTPPWQPHLSYLVHRTSSLEQLAGIMNRIFVMTPSRDEQSNLPLEQSSRTF